MSMMQVNSGTEQSEAKDLLKREGLTEQEVHLGDAPSHKLPVLKMQIDGAHSRSVDWSVRQI